MNAPAGKAGIDADRMITLCLQEGEDAIGGAGFLVRGAHYGNGFHVRQNVAQNCIGAGIVAHHSHSQVMVRDVLDEICRSPIIEALTRGESLPKRGANRRASPSCFAPVRMEI